MSCSRMSRCFEIHDLSQVWVQGFVSERDLSRVEVGQTVRVRFVADATEVVTGTLVRSGSSVGRTIERCRFGSNSSRCPSVPVQHNMLARLTIETGTIPPQLAVPREAIVREGLDRMCSFVKSMTHLNGDRWCSVGLMTWR